MRILCHYCHCGPSFVRTGWGHVFQALGHEFHWWEQERKPAFDVFDEVRPDLFLGTTFDLDRATYKCIAARPEMKVVLYASAWGDLINELPLDKYPIVAIKENEKVWLEKLKRETGKPDFVWLHYADAWVDRTLGGWRSIGIEPVGLMNAADVYDYHLGNYRVDLESDVAFVGGFWGYKGKNLAPYMLPLCHKSKGLRAKIWGNQPWPVAQYLGHVNTRLVKDIFRSAVVCPNVHEPHSTDFGFDIVERPFKVLSSGGFCVSDYVESMAKNVFNGDEIPFARSAGEFHDMVEHFVRHPEERIPYMERGYLRVIKEHTYFDRVQRIFEKLGMLDDAVKVGQLKFDFLKRVAT